jgi:hypothetical protein
MCMTIHINACFREARRGDARECPDIKLAQPAPTTRGHLLAGNHRVERPATGWRRRSPTVVVVAVAVAALLVPVYFGAHALLSSGATPPAHPIVRTTQPASPSVSPTPTPTPTPTPSPTPTTNPGSLPASKPLPRLRSAVPRRLAIAAVLDVTLDNSIQPTAGQFTPPSTAGVARWGTRGLPGSPGTDTVYIVGKINGPGSAFRRLATVRARTRIAIRTDAGLLTYTVTSVRGRRAQGLLTDPTFRAHVPGRLILIGVVYSGANRTGSLVLVTAELSGVKRG